MNKNTVPDPLELVRKVTEAQSAARKPRQLVNATEADGSNQIDGQGYGDTDGDEAEGRVIPGTKTVQHPALPRHASEEATDEVNEKLRAARAQGAQVTKSIAERLARGPR